jgi:tripartite-type tricarboxylate transporter receptor subunit TctC
MTKLTRRTLLAAAALAVGTPLAAQPGFPARPVTIVVPYAAGGLTDILARVVAPALAARWGQSVIVDNKPGGGTVIGTAAAARAPGDGHTLLMTAFGFTGNQLLVKNLPYDPKALAPLAMVAESPSVLYVAANFPASNVAELVAWAKANPGKLTVASSGNASSPHLAAEMFTQMTGIQYVHVPYKGNGPAINDLVGGQVQAMFDSPATISFVRAGKLKVLGVGSPGPNPRMPGVPPLAQTHPALADFVAGGWFGMFLPASTPAPLQQRIQADVRAVLETPAVREGLARAGVEPRVMTQAEFAGYLKADLDRWAPIVRERNIHLD